MKQLTKISFLAFILLLSFSCKKKGESAVKGEAAEVKETQGTNYAVDPVASMVTWSGSKIAGTHTGTLNISEGSISVKDGKVNGGSFTIDMASLTNTDQEGEPKANLEGHLKSPDFFDVAVHPTSKFVITKVTSLSNDPNGNALVYGNLTIKDVTKELGFKGDVEVANGGVNFKASNVNINRTDFGIKYGSSTFFDDLKDKAINDQVVLQLNVTSK